MCLLLAVLPCFQYLAVWRRMEPKTKDHKVADAVVGPNESTSKYRGVTCDCMRTSEKLQRIIRKFPSAPPPLPGKCDNTNVFVCCEQAQTKYPHGHLFYPQVEVAQTTNSALVKQNYDPFSEPAVGYHEAVDSKSWQVVFELVQLVQLSVTATALALYYLIYCYMQLVYFTLRSALYFHQADGPMKITIGVVTLTSLVVGFNLIMRVERFLKIV